MTAIYDRELIGYGANPPDPKWPGGARLAVNFVMNYEEGSEPSMLTARRMRLRAAAVAAAFLNRSRAFLSSCVNVSRSIPPYMG
jgi:hypothetical protein